MDCMVMRMPGMRAWLTAMYSTMGRNPIIMKLTPSRSRIISLELRLGSEMKRYF
jgi:hypothetical protein